MQKIISVNLAGRVLPVTDAAYEKLRDFFNQVRELSQPENGIETQLPDLESQVASLLSDRITVEHPTLQAADVEAVIGLVGYPESTPSAPPLPPVPVISSSSTESDNTTIGFFRNSNDKVLGGVCSGIAHLLGISPLLIRIGMVLFFFTGWGILIYLLLWLLAPVAPLPVRNGLHLYRSRRDRWLGGVCGGLARSFRVPSWVLRLAVLLPIIFGVGNRTFAHTFSGWLLTGTLSGTLLLLYCLLWMLLPLERREKMLPK